MKANGVGVSSLLCCGTVLRSGFVVSSGTLAIAGAWISSGPCVMCLGSTARIVIECPQYGPGIAFGVVGPARNAAVCRMGVDRFPGLTVIGRAQSSDDVESMLTRSSASSSTCLQICGTHVTVGNNKRSKR